MKWGEGEVRCSPKSDFARTPCLFWVIYDFSYVMSIIHTQKYIHIYSLFIEAFGKSSQELLGKLWWPNHESYALYRFSVPSPGSPSLFLHPYSIINIAKGNLACVCLCAHTRGDGRRLLEGCRSQSFEQVIGRGFGAYKENPWEEEAVRPSGKSTGKKSYDLALNPGPTTWKSKSLNIADCISVTYSESLLPHTSYQVFCENQVQQYLWKLLWAVQSCSL